MSALPTHSIASPMAVSWERVRQSAGATVVLLALAYFAAAKAGFAFAFQTDQVTAVWAPSGLAVAALLLGGLRLWPGVALGAFLANITSDEALAVALGITAGNTLAAVAATVGLRRVDGLRTDLNRMRDVVALAVAAVLSTLISAMVGVGSLLAGDVVPGDVAASVWRVWWLGDLCGVLLAGPLVLVAATHRDTTRWVRSVVAALALGALAAGAFLIDAAYPVLPLLFGIALFLRQPGAATGSLALSVVAVWMTSHDYGPFAIGSPDAALLRAQSFVAVVALTSLLAAAVRTERQHAEDMNDELERRVAQRTLELSAANRELEAFSYSVSHDLRAPLRAIDGFSLAVIEDHGEAMGADGRAMLQRVRSNSQRMAALIDEMLTLSRLTRQAMSREAVDVSAMCTQIAQALQAEAPDRAVEWDIAPDLVAHADRELVRTLLQNLLENAWKFTGPRSAARIVVQRDADGAFVVSDNGVGYDEAYADKLFRPFERLHRQDEFPGTGVGLTTVARIVHRHGGEVHARSNVDAGAAFAFTLGPEDRAR